MARLERKPYPGDWKWHEGEKFEAFYQRTKALLDAIPNDRIVSFPVADGAAMYFVVQMNPAVLQHIPYADAYRIPAAHLRGLTTRDIRENIRRQKGLRDIFAERKPA